MIVANSINTATSSEANLFKIKANIIKLFIDVEKKFPHVVIVGEFQRYL